MFIQDRDAGRHYFFQVWHKYRFQTGQMEPLEALVLGVILDHPEYHHYFNNEADAVHKEFIPESGQVNPFLHMGMHIAIKEQVGSDRPVGIYSLYQELLQAGWDSAHDLEHDMMECLGEVLWKAQRDNTLPDEQAYMECLRRLK